MESNQAEKFTVDTAITEAQARTELNATILKLRTKYGFAPPKDTTFVEMDQRCKELINETQSAVNLFVRATGKAPARMRNTTYYKTSKSFPQKKYEGLQAYANVPDEKLKRAPLYTAEAIGNLLNFNAEYLLRVAHQEAVTNRTRKEWKRLEYEYVERSDYNLRDLYDDLMKLLDAPENNITFAEYREERRKWRHCKYFACDNYFPIAKDHFIHPNVKARRPNAQYCCGGCKKAQENAEARFQKTGTYLPEDAYQYVLEETRERKEKNNIAKSPEKIVEISDKSS